MTRGGFYVRVLMGAGREHMLGVAMVGVGAVGYGKMLQARSLAPLEKPTAVQIQAARKAAESHGGTR
jgi:hypothetical protein